MSPFSTYMSPLRDIFKFVIFVVEDVDVEEPDELDRFDVLPSQQPDGKEAELDKEETQPLTNIRNFKTQNYFYSLKRDFFYLCESIERFGYLITK